MFTPNEYGLFSMPTLETPRLILRRMTMKDAKDIFEYSRDEEVACHVLWSAQRDIGEAKDYCRYMLRRYRADEPSSWGIIDRQTRHLVGTIGYMDYSMDNASVEIGYSLARWLWNGGRKRLRGSSTTRLNRWISTASRLNTNWTIPPPAA